MPRCLSASFVTIMQPRPVASRRPSEPPISTGLPVTTAVTVWPTRIEYVSMTHAITRSFVFTSGAGTSESGPRVAKKPAGERPRRRPHSPAAHLSRAPTPAAFRPPERQVHDRALPVHPRRERLYFLERHLHVEPNTAFGGAARRIVEHAVTGEHLDFAVVHHHRHGHGDLLLGVPKHLVQPWLQIQQLRGPIEPRHHGLKWVLLIEKAVFIRANNSISRESEIGGHWQRCGPAQSAVGGVPERTRTRSSSTRSRPPTPRSTITR